ncbi:hypothetical protein [Nonomuraea sp. CA-141351]|uniref:hypothetical protein n=1 Tax=Nonomuraea sp. CA-141351 TaxID=3239996 RepID=UPI003D8A3A86
MWTPALAALVTDLFKEMAPVWDAEHATGRLDFLTDALDRGGPPPNGICLELGSGTGQPAPVVLAHARRGFVVVGVLSAVLDETTVPRRAAYAVCESVCHRASELLGHALG